MRRAWTRLIRFLSELARRKVYRATVLYVVLAAGALEVLDILIPSTTLPEWAVPVLFSVAVVGLPVVVVLSWTFDLTRGGVVRTGSEVDDGDGLDEQGRGAPEALEVRKGSSVDASPEITAVAVLPFDNLSGAPDAEPFAVGLHDDLLTELSRASALTVISRTSVRGYRGTDKGIREIARELGVGTIVEGAVQKAGNRVRLNIQVIDARTDSHRWAERYDRDLTPESIFELQSELAIRIMESVEAELTSEERARVSRAPTEDLEAYRLYSLGREAHVDRSEGGMRTAASFFQRALERDPDYASAWAGLGIALVGLVDYGHVADEEVLERGIAALERAVELDPELPEAHAGIGSLRVYLHDGEGAREALGKAVELGPGLALGYQWRSWVELLLGDPEAAARAGGRATRVAPLDPEARGNVAMALLGTGDLARAADEASRSLESHPEFAYGRWVLALALDQMGRRDEAGEELERLSDESLSPWPIFAPWARVGRGLRKAGAGDVDGVRQLAAELDEAGTPFEAGVLAAVLGDSGRAFEAFRRAMPLEWDDALALRYARGLGLGALRDDPAHRELLEELDRSWKA
jgi:TolB-like protein/Flp pilus assembly protein TadD